jgi:hypothetical protein
MNFFSFTHAHRKDTVCQTNVHVPIKTTVTASSNIVTASVFMGVNISTGVAVPTPAVAGDSLKRVERNNGDDPWHVFTGRFSGHQLMDGWNHE